MFFESPLFPACLTIVPFRGTFAETAVWGGKQMQLGDRQKAFVNAVKARFGATKLSKINQAFGVSNSAKVIDGGIQLGVPNLQVFKADVDMFVLCCLIRFPPEDEVFFAVKAAVDVPVLAARLDDMKRLGAKSKEKKGEGGDDSDDAEESDASDEAGEEGAEIEAGEQIAYSHRNNVVATYLSAEDGGLYFRNKKFWDSLRFDLSGVGPRVRVDEIAVAIYPPAASARRSTLAREFVGYLGKMVGRNKVFEIKAFPDERAVGELMRRMPATLDIKEIRKHVEALGGHYVDRLVERFHEGLNFLPHKHFVILKGLSGTGKTQLAIKYARAVHGLGAGEPDPLLFVCPVRTEWTDPTGLTGYHDVLTNRYVVPEFLEAVLVATAYRASPVFVVLDEMNLARVEHYFSDVLSAIESGHPIQLHSNSVPLEGSTGGEIRAEINFPPNIFLVGTVNVDETTNPISDKVLDRSIVIDMSTVDLEGFLSGLKGRELELAASVDACSATLIAVDDIMGPHAQGFGYRVAEEVIRYHRFAVGIGRGSDDVIDDMLVQKVLVKLKGAHTQRPMLDALAKAVVGRERSAQVVARMQAELDELGSFRNAR